MVGDGGVGDAVGDADVGADAGVVAEDECGAAADTNAELGAGDEAGVVGGSRKASSCLTHRVSH